MEPQSLELTGVGKGFGAEDVLRSIDLAIRPGEFLSLVGMSGCGKSTLLRIIAGLETPDRGRFTIGGQDVTALDPADRNLAMVFQSYALYPHMTVRQNIATPLRMRQLSQVARLPVLGRLVPGRAAAMARIGVQVAEAAETLQIGHLLDRKPAELSGGQRQRVALARALVRDPAAFLMDEPLSNLDAKLRAHMRSELAALHRRLGATFVYVTHDQIEAMTMSDRIALMQAGQIEQLGTPTELYERPATLTVARFIGTPAINLLPAEVDSAGRVRVLGLETGLSAPRGATGAATLGVRPEDLRPGRGGIRARVLHTEHHGADRYVSVLPEGLADRPLTLRLAAGASLPADADGRLHLAFVAERAHLFGADGVRLDCHVDARVSA
ncbi:carbohydrate ABC transporter ATP-binding protein, CUT1 family [Gemmobacter megaterium]|uniref:Carbohydrate ABC transporter ATP-binding protein, CUT1 family n=1 Tax=Gemmobacter megaterium TaxID=1086013 RepID=A0A1N7N6B3_9RHOB|nr:ABC transporter ATP-binding protein [Gemmobacter megaterium]GGE13213.1 glycerol-3-phosphate ABC transporter ATP-binding protein [Gemmobacter megaterium]SIS93691.1 carbohydrate ABC transporter ATP-binding protein, CUT1 family [Gemmobacter megaterium]